MILHDVIDRADIEDIVQRFYETTLTDPIIGFIFTDVAKIDLEQHLPIIVDFWSDSLLEKDKVNNGIREKGKLERRYTGNPLQAHLDIHQKIPLKPGHFTRWLFLFNKAVDERHSGANADKMKRQAESVAQSISAAISARKRGDMNLVLR